MIKQISLHLFLFISFSGYSQNNYEFIDNKSKSTPDTIVTYENISKFLTKDLKSDREKIRAIFVWITHNIVYDETKMNETQFFYSTEKISSSTLLSRSGVCRHYSELFYAMCTSIGIKSYIISGYIRNENGQIPKLRHVWNAVLIEGKYYFIDALWASGYSKNGIFFPKFQDTYFLMKPENFVKTHYPFDPIWQFLNNPLSPENFQSQDFLNLETVGFFNFKDSISKFNNLDKINQLQNSKERIIQSGIANDHIRKELLLIATQIMNIGLEKYNSFILEKNNLFVNSIKKDNEIKELIFSARSITLQAKIIFDDLMSYNSKENYKQKDNELIDFTSRFKARVSDFLPKIENEILILSVKMYNQGVKQYNEYINYKNNLFRNPKIEDDSIKKLITSAKNFTLHGKTIIEDLIKYNENNNIINDSIQIEFRTNLQKKIEGLLLDIDKEIIFVEKYIIRKRFRFLLFL